MAKPSIERCRAILFRIAGDEVQRVRNVTRYSVSLDEETDGFRVEFKRGANDTVFCVFDYDTASRLALADNAVYGRVVAEIRRTLEQRARPRLASAALIFYDFVPHFFRGHCPPKDSSLWIEFVTEKGTST